tara:strand:- start:18064 stop:18327 length:264 start_codon:yes stop_codon:yes gene_type:complete
MKWINVATIILGLSTIFYLSYNTYFGWNLEPHSVAEVWCDIISQGSYKLACILFLSPLVGWYVDFIESHEKKMKDQELAKELNNKVD